jgi:hypothetical protein
MTDYSKCWKIPLTRGKVAYVSEEDYERVSKYKWLCMGHGYAARSRRKDEGKKGIVYMHRFILGVEDGEVDHVDGDRLDNRRENLRLVTHSQNLMNQKPQNGRSSKYKGVYWDEANQSWKVQIKKKNDYRILCGFASEYMASRVYDILALDSFGEYARPNHEDSKLLVEDNLIHDRIASEREKCAKMAEDNICGCGDHSTELAARIREGK